MFIYIQFLLYFYNSNFFYYATNNLFNETVGTPCFLKCLDLLHQTSLFQLAALLVNVRYLS